MQIDETIYKEMPEHLQQLFVKLPNPGSDEVVGLFPKTKSGAWNNVVNKPTSGPSKGDEKQRPRIDRLADSGSAARFFYTAKASRKERNAGLDAMEEHVTREWRTGNAPPNVNHRVPDKKSRNHHPTVKPLALMEYLCKLTRTPTGGVVLDPFMGSGTTGIACIKTGRDFVGIEIDSDYFSIAETRINHAKSQPAQMELPHV